MTEKSDQMPLFELVETEDLPTAPRGWISWEELQERWGIDKETIEEDDGEGSMSPIEDEAEHEQDVRDMIWTPVGPQ